MQTLSENAKEVFGWSSYFYFIFFLTCWPKRIPSHTRAIWTSVWPTFFCLGIIHVYYLNAKQLCDLRFTPQPSSIHGLDRIQKWSEPLVTELWRARSIFHEWDRRCASSRINVSDVIVSSGGCQLPVMVCLSLCHLGCRLASPTHPHAPVHCPLPWRDLSFPYARGAVSLRCPSPVIVLREMPGYPPAPQLVNPLTSSF